jgi:alpha-ribazole phosphatase
MNNQLDIYLIRHTEPLIEVGTCYGQFDCGVKGDYVNELSKINHYFKGKEINAIYSSPLQRCAKLAEDIAQANNVSPVIYKEGFKEISFGDWEGLKWDDIPRREIDQWNNNRLHFQFPNGETPWIFVQRVLEAYLPLQLDNRTLQVKKRTLLIIAHAGVIRTILAKILCLSFSDSLNVRVDKPSVSLCSFNNGVFKYHLSNINLNTCI